MRWIVGVVLAAGMGVGLLTQGACTGPEPQATPERTPEIDPTPGIHLAENMPFVELSIPDDSRGGAPIASTLQLDGGWLRRGPNKRGGYLWSRPTPFRPRGMFFHKAQPGMHLQRSPTRAVPYRNAGGGGGLSWRHDAQDLLVNTRNDAPPPPLEFQYPRAEQRERHLHYRDALAAGWVKDKASFVRGTTIQEGWISRQGLLLPAPARVSWKIQVPEAGQLTMEPGLVRPEFADLDPSDGCKIVVRIGEAEQAETVFEKHYTQGQFSNEVIDLSKWAGQEVLLAIETQPGESALQDFCFVGGPIVSKKKAHPRRVIMVFVDTLRPDHLSTFGYDRETTPNLDRLAKRSTVFTQARSIAPWTLPSARTVITGFQPELYDSVESLPARLGREGFATAMIAGNVYLSANFGMNKDWDHHEVGMFPPANEVTDSALAWLKQHEGSDALLQVHYMSAHLPYKEPPAFRDRFAGTGPPGLQHGFLLPAVRQAARDERLNDDTKAYIRDRYDNCVLWIDHELQRLYTQLEPEDILVFYSDHGEEFWDHGGYEHGHTLYDELLRVPLLIKAPGLRAGTVDVPVSLLDVAPTILDLLGFEGPSQGTSLVPAAKGDTDALNTLTQRPQAIGRPLYGRERWGVITDQKKWTTSEGQEHLYDLVADPHEDHDLARSQPMPPYREALGKALNTRAGIAYRFLPTRNASYARQVDLKVHVPGGIEHAWFGADALQRSKGTVQVLSDDEVLFTWHKGYRGTREAYVLPKKPVEQVTRQIRFKVRSGEAHFRQVMMPDTAPTTPGPKRHALHALNLQDGVIKVTWAIAPAVDEDWMALDATDSETSDWLEALGYTRKDEPK